MKTLELDTREKYSDSSIYAPDNISASLFEAGEGFSSLLQAEKLKLLLPNIAGKRVLDLGCANGRHLGEIASQIEFGVGVDSSLPFIRHAADKLKSISNLRFVLADARSLPIAAHSIDTAYSFGTLYYVDDIDPVYAELSRILSPDGVAVLEVGNSISLSTLVSRRHPTLAQHSRRTISEHLGYVERHRLRVMNWRSFQILPMWGDPPPPLRPLRAPKLERLVVRQIGGHMVDEWVSSLPVIRMIAFRHLLVLRAPAEAEDAKRPSSEVSRTLMKC